MGLFTVYASESVSETFLRRRGRGGGGWINTTDGRVGSQPVTFFNGHAELFNILNA